MFCIHVLTHPRISKLLIFFIALKNIEKNLSHAVHGKQKSHCENLTVAYFEFAVC
jgi:hypothetical protein